MMTDAATRVTDPVCGMRSTLGQAAGRSELRGRDLLLLLGLL